MGRLPGALRLAAGNFGDPFGSLREGVGSATHNRGADMPIYDKNTVGDLPERLAAEMRSQGKFAEAIVKTAGGGMTMAQIADELEASNARVAALMAELKKHEIGG